LNFALLNATSVPENVAGPLTVIRDFKPAEFALISNSYGPMAMRDSLDVARVVLAVLF
jgi:hypothetical protein